MLSVAGIGIISAIGNNADETLQSLRQERSGIGRMRYLSSIHKELPVGEVKATNQELKAMLGIADAKDYSRTALLGAIAVRQAVADCKQTLGDIKGKRIVLISGTTVGSMDLGERIYAQGDALAVGRLPLTAGTNTEEIARLAELDCEVCTISTACSSALNAIIVGCEMLKNNEADIVIAGGTEALSLFHINGFNSLKITDHERCRPFDATREGLNLGEGAAYICLTSCSSLCGGRERVFIAGYSNRCDAFHQTATSENGEGAYLAMTDAIRNAGLKPADIDYVNAHGTGTPDNDLSESIALKRVFGNEMPAVSSTKGYTGHTTSASGSIELVISILAMRHGFIPSNIGWRNQMDDGITPSMGVKNAVLRNVLCNSFGFGGNDSTLVISSEPTYTSPQKETLAVGHWPLAANNERLKVLADITIDSTDQLKDLKEYISPLASRRMGNMMKAAMLSSLMALKEAGLERPDAIIAATAYGMADISRQFLDEIITYGEEGVSPTLFMQSTHNTIASAIAIRTKCHGYNITYTQNDQSKEWAMRDARRLLSSGMAENVLVIECDEMEGLYSRSQIIVNKF